MTKGFTLIELLVVIAILAVLATAVVLVLNPAELLKQGRDSTRISDLAALNSALALYLADVSTPNLGTITACPSTGNPRCTATTTSPFTNHSSGCNTTSTGAVTGGGWVDVNFGLISSGSPLPREPIDPANDTTACGSAGNIVCAYSYACGNGGSTYYEIDAYMESTKYNTSSSSVTNADGGDNTNVYEVGNSLTQ